MKIRKYAAAFFAALQGGIALAAGTNTIITVHASRIDDAKDAMAASIGVFTSGDIAASGARDLPDLLKKEAGIDVHAMNSNPLLTSIAMRGFGDNAFGRTKVLFDGEEINAVDMSTPNLARIPLGSVGRVEVLRGPCPVLYGDGAVAGVVNVTTDGEDYSRLTRLTGKAGSQNTYGANFLTRGGYEEEGLVYNAAYDYIRSSGYRRHSEYGIHAANAGIRRNFGNGSHIGFKANYQNAYYDLPGSLTFDQWKRSRKAANNRDDWTRLWSYGLAFDSKIMLDEDRYVMVDGSFSHRYRHARMFAWNNDNEYSSYAYALSPRYVDETDLFGHASKFTLGTDLRFDTYADDPAAGRTMRFRRERYAIFAQEEFWLTDEFSLLAGARGELIGNRWKGRGGAGETRNHDIMGDFEIAAIYRPVEGLKTYIKATRFHRSAFCDESSYTQDGKFLDPETGYSADAGLDWEFADEFKFDFDAYAMWMKDEIFFDPAMAPFGYNRNSPANTRRFGIDTGFAWKRDKTAEASIRYGVVKAYFDGGRYDGNDVPFVPNHRLRAEAGWWICADLEIKGGCTYTSRQYVSGDFDNSSDRLASYTLFDIGLYYEPSWAKGWKASFTIDNLFDRDYCDYAGVGYYYPACGRSCLFTLSYEF